MADLAVIRPRGNANAEASWSLSPRVPSSHNLGYEPILALFRDLLPESEHTTRDSPQHRLRSALHIQPLSRTTTH